MPINNKIEAYIVVKVTHGPTQKLTDIVLLEFQKQNLNNILEPQKAVDFHKEVQKGLFLPHFFSF